MVVPVVFWPARIDAAAPGEVVQPSPGVSGDQSLADELTAFAREHLAGFKVPRSIDFLDELPRLPTGKLYKRHLRDPYWAKANN